MKTYLILIFIFAFSAIPLSLNQSPTLIDYRHSLNSNRVCSKGRLQSPINLTNSISNFLNGINFSEDYRFLTGNMVFNYDGSAYSLTAAPGKDFGSLYVLKDGYLTKNLLTSVKVNFPCEHTIDGNMGDVEVKLVHTRVLDFSSGVGANRNLPSINTSFVIVLLFKNDPTLESDNGFLSGLFDGWLSNTETPFFSSLNLNLNISDMSILKAKQFFYYEGSQTFVPCNENVSYLIINQFFRMDPSFYTFIANQFSLRYTLSRANKAVSDINGRPVYRNFITQSEGAALKKSGYYKLGSYLFYFIMALFVFCS